MRSGCRPWRWTGTIRARLERALRSHDGGLRVVVAQTRKGCGVSFMEDRMEWHYLPMTEAQYRQAVQEIEEACETHSARP